MQITIEYLRGNLEPADGHYDMDAVQFEYERIAADLISQSYPNAEIVFCDQPGCGGGEKIYVDYQDGDDSYEAMQREESTIVSIRADLARAFEEIDWQKCEA